MRTIPIPPTLRGLLDRYRADRDAAIEAEVDLLAARHAAAGRAGPRYEAAAAAAQAADQAVRCSAVAVAEALLQPA